MMLRITKWAGPTLLLGAMLYPLHTAPQDKNSSVASDSLQIEILRMDARLFDAFNRRDLATQKSIFAKDIEFYHDKGGVTNYDTLIRNTERLFAQNNGLTRTLIPGSSEVYPVANYGAIQTGQHTFCHIENGREDCGTFKFLHIWRNSGGRWELTRVVSYGH